jgi:DNA topoisomerase IA
VKLVVEKEIEIRNFKPVESWKIIVTLSHGKIKFETTLHKVDGKVKKLSSKEDVLKVLSVLLNDITTLEEGKNKK